MARQAKSQLGKLSEKSARCHFRSNERMDSQCIAKSVKRKAETANQLRNLGRCGDPTIEDRNRGSIEY